MGHEAWNLEKQGIITRAGIINRQIMARNKEQQTRDKLADIQKKQAIQHMNKLNESYITLKSQISDFHNAIHQREREISKMESQIKSLQQRTEDISKQNDNLQQAYAVRDCMERFKDKREINAQIKRLEDTYRHSWDYYQHSFGITPNEGHQEIERLKHQREKAYEETYILRCTTDTTTYTERLRKFEIEYKRQRLLAELRPDSKEVLQSLDKPATSLSRITNDDFREIIRDMPKQQADMIKVKLYSPQRERDYYEHVR